MVAWGALASGLGSLLSFGGGLMGAHASREAAEMQFQHQKALQESAQSWMEKMSNTAHQREMADLQAAGINPILTATGGNGAVTPASSTGSASMSDEGMIKANMAIEGFKNALAAKQTNSNIELQKAQAKQAEASAREASTHASLNETASTLNIINSALKNIEVDYAERKQLLTLRKMELDNLNTHVSTNLMREEILNQTYKRDLMYAQAREHEANNRYQDRRSGGYGTWEAYDKMWKAFGKEHNIPTYQSF